MLESNGRKVRQMEKRHEQALLNNLTLFAYIIFLFKYLFFILHSSRAAEQPSMIKPASQKNKQTIDQETAYLAHCLRPPVKTLNRSFLPVWSP